MLSSLSEGFDAKSISGHLFSTIFLTRRLVYVVTIFFLEDQHGLQILFIELQALVVTCYLVYGKPMLGNNLEVYNELCFMLIAVSLLPFTDAFDY